MPKRCLLASCTLGIALAAAHPLLSEHLRLVAVQNEPANRIRVILECSDSVGRRCSQVDPKATRLVIDGEVQTFPPLSNETLTQSRIPVSLLVAVDTSGSMKGRPLEVVRSALARFVARARTGDLVAVMTFDDEVEVKAPFGSDAKDWSALLQTVAPRGSRTRLFDAIVQAAKYVDGAPAANLRRVLVISDGRDEGSQNTVESAARAAAEASIPLDSIGVTNSDPAYLSSLVELSKQTAGFYRVSSDSVELKRTLDAAIDNILADEVMTFDAPSKYKDGARHLISVKYNAGVIGVERPTLIAMDKAATEGSEPRSKRMIWIGVVASLAVAFLIGAFLLWRARRPDPASEPGGHWAGNQQLDEVVVPKPPPAPYQRVLPDDGFFDEPVKHEISPARLVAEQEEGSFEPVKQGSKRTIVPFEFPVPSEGHPSAYVSWQEGSGPRFEHPIIATTTSFGADSGCEILLSNGWMAMPRHACIEFRDGLLFLRSQHGQALVELDGEEYVNERRLLQPGSIFVIANRTFRLTRERVTRNESN